MRTLRYLQQHLPAKIWDNLATASILGALAVLACGFYLIVHNNDARINDIQKSRIESCRRTYEGVRQVFQPLLPPRKKQTPKQRSDIDKFNTTVNNLKHGCVKQIRR